MLILMVFEFWHLDHLGPRKVDFSDFGPHTGKFYLVIFSKNQKFVQKWPKWGLFCSEFCTDYCAVVCLGLARTTYAKIAKNRRKIGQNCLALDSIFSKLGSKSKNRKIWCTRYAYGLSNTLNHLILSFSWSKIYCIKWKWPKNRKSRFFAWA